MLRARRIRLPAPAIRAWRWVSDADTFRSVYRLIPQGLRDFITQNVWGVFIATVFGVALFILTLLDSLPVTAVVLIVVLGPVALFTFLIWTSIGVRNWRAGVSEGTPTGEEESESESKRTRLRVTPLVAKYEARLRVENEGPATNVAFQMVRIGDQTSGNLPYRMRWQPGVGETAMIRRVRGERTQKYIGIGEVETVVVAKSAAEPGDLFFPWPGGEGLSRAVTESIECEVVVLADPKPEQASRHIYRITVDDDGVIVGFEEVQQDAGQS